MKKYEKQGYKKETLSQYDSHIRQFRLYCETLEVRAFPLQQETVKEFMAWLIHTGRPGSLKGAWTAIVHEQEDKCRQEPPFVKTKAVKALERAAEMELTKRGAKPRDAFLSSMARYFCVKVNKYKRDDVMGAAILTIGIRGFLRAGEIMGLKFKHITAHFGYLTLNLGSRKNRRRDAPVIFLDESRNKSSCPVKNLQRWMEMRKTEGHAGPEDYVFTTAPKKKIHISYKHVSDLVRKAAEMAGASGNFSGHSLRIGGATEALMAGFSELQVRVMGDWKSDAYMRYLRAVEPAALGASRRMGL